MSKEQQDYDAFVEKFKPKRTTDDCYTPPLVYDALLRWARNELKIDGRPVVRPFYPGGDYEHYDYPERCVVVDNPPFSIFAEIVNFYTGRGIDFLLFAPAMTSIRPNCCFIGTGNTITYENGAQVNTSFVTNLVDDICFTSPTLFQMVTEANNKTQQAAKKQLAKLAFPDCVLRATTLQRLSRAGIDFRVRKGEGAVGTFIARKVGCFGNSILLSDKKTDEKLAAEKLAAEKLAAGKLKLSDKAKAILDELNKESKCRQCVTETVTTNKIPLK